MQCNEALKQKYKERSDKKIYLSENATASVLRKHRLIKNKKCMGIMQQKINRITLQKKT